MTKKTYIVKIKRHRGEPSFVPQYVFAASAREAIQTARGQGFIVRDAVAAETEYERPSTWDLIKGGK